MRANVADGSTSSNALTDQKISARPSEADIAFKSNALAPRARPAEIRVSHQRTSRFSHSLNPAKANALPPAIALPVERPSGGRTRSALAEQSRLLGRD